MLSDFFEDCCLLEEVSEGLVLVVHPVEVGLQQGETVRMFFMLHIEVIITLYGDINKNYTLSTMKNT